MKGQFMKKIILFVILVLLAGCTASENKEAIDYLESSDSNIVSKRTGEEYVWEKKENNIYYLARSENGQFVEYTIDFSEKYIQTTGYYEHKPEEVSTAVYYWNEEVGSFYDKDSDCFIKINMRNKSFVSDECDCVYQYENQEAYKNNKTSTIWWDKIYNATIDPFLNTPIDPYKLK